jgi:hypothetical protein
MARVASGIFVSGGIGVLLWRDKGCVARREDTVCRVVGAHWPGVQASRVERQVVVSFLAGAYNGG